MWRGENRLGEVLTEVRNEMLKNGDVGDNTLVQHFTYYSVDNIMCVFKHIFLDDWLKRFYHHLPNYCFYIYCIYSCVDNSYKVDVCEL